MEATKVFYGIIIFGIQWNACYGEGGKNIAMLQLKTLIKDEIELPLECTKFLVSNNVAWEGNRYRIEH